MTQIVFDRLRDTGIASDAVLASSQLVVAPADHHMVSGNRFDPGERIGLLMEGVRHALAEGFEGLRFAGDASCVADVRAGTELLTRYEYDVSPAFDQPLTMLCLFDSARFSATEIGALEDAHDIRIDLQPPTGRLETVTSTVQPRRCRIIGEIDGCNLAQLVEVVNRLAAHDDDIHLDLSELRFIDAAATGWLCRYARNLPSGRRLLLSAVSATTNQMIRILGAHQTPNLVIDGVVDNVRRHA
jgi:anti-anti-sigma factor